MDRTRADGAAIAGSSAWPHPFAQWQDDPLRSPPALVARLRATPQGGDALRVATISAVHRVLDQASVPHVLPIRTVHRDANGRLVLVYRPVAATDLGTLLKRGPLPEARAFAILRQVCRSLAAAHAIGIDHRALGPASVLVESQGDGHDRVWIADFGIASLFDGDDGTNAVELHPCTPERMFGGGSETSEDVYLVGCLAFRLFTGAPPFVADDLATLQRCHAIEEPKRPSELAIDGVPAGLDELVARALTKEPDERWADVAELDAELGRIQRERGISTPWDDTIPPRTVVAPAAANDGEVRGSTMVLRTTAVLPVPGPIAPAPVAPPAPAPMQERRRVLPLVLVSIGFSLGLVVLGLADGPEPTDTNDFVARRGTTGERAAPVAAALVPEEAPEIERVSVEDSPVVAAPVESSIAEPPIVESPPPPLPPVPGPVAAPVVDTPTPKPAPSIPARAKVRASAPAPKAARAEDDGDRKAACELVRRAAEEARRTHDWAGLLRHAGTRGCWPSDAQRTRYKVKALMELHRFEACVEAGHDATDMEVIRWVALCRKRTEVQ
jgi:hypothetical protein